MVGSMPRTRKAKDKTKAKDRDATDRHLPHRAIATRRHTIRYQRARWTPSFAPNCVLNWNASGRESGTTILYVTHDQIEAMTMADRISIMWREMLIQVGTPREIYERPNSAYVASRLGAPAINLDFQRSYWAATECRVRREPRACGLSISRSPRRIVRDRSQVRWVEHLGDRTRAFISIFATHSLVTLADPVQELKAGDQVSLEFTEPLYFDQAGNRIGTDGAGGHA